MKSIVKVMVVFFTIAAMSILSYAGETGDSEYYISETGQLLFNKLNNIRMANGLDPLVYSDILSHDADIRAEESSVSFSHTRPDKTEWYTVDIDHMYGENLSKGYEPEVVTDRWFESDSHKANMLSREFKTVGFGIIYVNGVCYITEEFGL